MFKRKLTALKFEAPEKFNYKDDNDFRNFIVWLENQKIRLYKIEDREALDDIENINWPTALNKYLDDLNCQVNRNDRALVIEWLLTTAVRFEYSDNVERYNNIRDRSFVVEKTNPTDNILENLDYNSNEFKSGLTKLQNLLNMPQKPDDTLTNLKAVSKLISEKFNPNAVQTAINNANVVSKDQIAPLTLQTISLGFDTNDYILNEASKILRLLHIKELRNLQTNINETIVALQLVTANPKTDASLGKVGF